MDLNLFLKKDIETIIEIENNFILEEAKNEIKLFLDNNDNITYLNVYYLIEVMEKYNLYNLKLYKYLKIIIELKNILTSKIDDIYYFLLKIDIDFFNLFVIYLDNNFLNKFNSITCSNIEKKIPLIINKNKKYIKIMTNEDRYIVFEFILFFFNDIVSEKKELPKDMIENIIKTQVDESIKINYEIYHSNKEEFPETKKYRILESIGKEYNIDEKLKYQNEFLFNLKKIVQEFNINDLKFTYIEFDFFYKLNTKVLRKILKEIKQEKNIKELFSFYLTLDKKNKDYLLKNFTPEQKKFWEKNKIRRTIEADNQSIINLINEEYFYFYLLNYLKHKSIYVKDFKYILSFQKKEFINLIKITKEKMISKNNSFVKEAENNILYRIKRYIERKKEERIENKRKVELKIAFNFIKKYNIDNLKELENLVSDSG